MEILPCNPADHDVLDIVERWVRDLAREDYATAFSRTSHDPYYSWSPELIRDVISGYGFPESHPSGPFKVTDPDTAQGSGRREVRRLNLPDGAIASVHYDLPLNGEFSDLTATFRVEPKGEHSEIILEEIHVF